jgi:cation-transporting ATPase 13A1
MYWGIVGVSGLAFVCAMELVPEINQQMKLVPFTEEFKTKMTASMVLDFGLCWLIERGLKWGFSDFRPRDIAERRPDQLEREMARKEILAQKKAEEDEKKAQEKVLEFERKVEERRRALENWRAGRQN